VTVSSFHQHHRTICLITTLWIQGSGSGGTKRKTEVSIGITQSIQMDNIQSVHANDQDSYDERKIVGVA
jgi:hypothetical protein